MTTLDYLGFSPQGRNDSKKPVCFLCDFVLLNITTMDVSDPETPD